MNEDLIAQIIRKVMEDPRVQELLGGGMIASPKPEMLILLNYTHDLLELLQKARALWGEMYSLKILATDAVMKCRLELPAGMSWITCQMAMQHKNWQSMVLPTCSANTLAKIALGLRDTPISIMAAEGISSGIPVELYTGCLGFTEKMPAPYRALYESYLDQVRNYGVAIRETLGGQNTPGRLATGKTESNNERREKINWNKGLLTEKDVIEFPTDCTIVVTKQVIVTPLARDTLKRRRVEIFRNMEEAG